MSDLSRLNLTPHAIAVYASQPLSPGATQHSLPSGRYSLLGPDFHRLDRTSLRLAHSFDQPCRDRCLLAFTLDPSARSMLLGLIIEISCLSGPSHRIGGRQARASFEHTAFATPNSW